MTTDGTTEATETTESEATTTKRSIGELLSLGTFQGCTDEEIQSIIDFKVELALQNEETKTKQAAIIEEMNANVETWRSAAQESHDLLKQLVLKGVTLEAVTDEGEASE